MRDHLAGVAALLALFAWACGGCAGDRQQAVPELNVFVAASLTEVIQEAGEAFEKEHDVRLAYNIAGSGALAKQILAAPVADVFLSASRRWMDEVEQGGRVLEGTRVALLSNTLVVVAHRSSEFQEIGAAGELAAVPFKYLSVGDPAYVPAGRYAKEWLESVAAPGGEGAVWDGVKDRTAPAPDVRAALTQVRGSDDVVGIVYGSDLVAWGDVLKVLFRVSQQEGPPILYDAAGVRGTEHPELVKAFLEFLSGEDAKALFRRHGFVPL